MADAVLSMSGAAPRATPITGAPRAQRKCASCEDDEASRTGTVRRDPLPGGAASPQQAPPAVHDALRSGGEPLGEDTRSFFEPRMGVDLAGVRVHTGAEASGSARAIAAKAYTFGRDIVFGEGQYAPGTPRGQRLLAHELAHVVQQSRGAPAAVQREGDFEIGHKYSGEMATRVFFTGQQAILDAAEKKKLAAFATEHPEGVTLFGDTSEDIADPQRTAIIQARMRAVEAELKAHGYAGDIKTKQASTKISHGEADYAFSRSVALFPKVNKAPPAGAKKAEPATGPCTMQDRFMFEDNGARFHGFVEARLRAIHMIQAAQRQLRSSLLYHGAIEGGPDPMADESRKTLAVARTYFGPDVDVHRIITGLEKIAEHLATKFLLDDTLVCSSGSGDDCSNKDTMAFVSSLSTGVTLCPSFHDAPLDMRARVLVHEGSHATPGPIDDKAPPPVGGAAGGAAVMSKGTQDYAYGQQRVMRSLPTAMAEQNADSWALLVTHLNGIDDASLQGAPVKDDVSKVTGPKGSTAQEGQEAAQRAVGWLERWLAAADSQSAAAYRSLTAAVDQGAASPSSGAFRELRDIFFANERDAPVTSKDKPKYAAIADRMSQMGMRMSKGLTFSQNDKAKTSWSGSGIVLGSDFFASTHLVSRIQLLLTALVHDIPGITQGRERDYVIAVDALRALAGSGPDSSAKP